MKKGSGNVIFIIPAIIGVIAVIGVICALFSMGMLGKKTSEEVSAPAEEISVTAPVSEGDDKPSYVTETNYNGNLEQFPELYEIPFGKSDAYICNKDFATGNYELFNECESDAKEFFETLFNFNYRDVAVDTSKFVAKAMAQCQYDAHHTEGFDTEDEKTEYFFEYIDRLVEYMVDNKMQVDARFYTDDSLVYSDYYIFVRGELVFTIYDCKEPVDGYEIKTEYSIPMEVAMQRSPTYPSDHLIVGFGRADDPMFFVNP